MGTAKGMVAAMRAYVGIVGRPNRVTRAYASRNGSVFLRAAWCDMTVTEAARASGNFAAVCPKGDRAYTVWHAEDFRKLGRWYAGTAANVNKAKPGDIVFFDWGGSDSIGAIDHVGVVVKALGGGRVRTIEGNTSDSCRERERSYRDIAGYGRPDYDGKGAAPAKPKPAPKPAGKAPKFPGRILRQPPLMSGSDVKTWQSRMKARGWKITVDGVYGPASEDVCRAFQRDKRLTVDGEVGPVTWAAAWTSPVT